MLKSAPIVPYIPVKDVAAARKFYEGVLGFEPGEEGPAGIIYSCGAGTRVFVYQSPGAGTSKASTAFWDVADTAAEVAELRKKGVKFEHYDMPGTQVIDGDIYEGGGAKVAWFKDPDGNILAIAQTL